MAVRGVHPLRQTLFWGWNVASGWRDHRKLLVIDELGYDLVDVPGVSVEETVFESFEHG